jgi:23S rRNA (cytosine1962-C5)-methyltransferase
MADTVGPVARGHPWVYQNGISGQLPPPGTLVTLQDSKGATVGFGLCDSGAIAVRVLGRQPMSLERCLEKKLEVALRIRKLVGGETDCYRLLNGEGDGLSGLVVDRYASVLVVKIYAHAWEKWLDVIVAALREVQGIKSIYRRFGVERVDNREGGEKLWGEEPEDVLVVKEHGVKLLVRVKVGQKTGLFLDQREHRRLIRLWSAGLSVTNLFSYNGGFSINAALGGASRVISVDQSEPALRDAKEIFRLNGIDPAKHGFEVADVFKWEGSPVELLICDPPSLARNKEDESKARRAYKELHRKIGPLAKQFLATSSCTARLSFERWEESVREGLGTRGWASLHRSAESVDHPVALAHAEGRYLKFLLLGRSA